MDSGGGVPTLQRPIERRDRYLGISGSHEPIGGYFLQATGPCLDSVWCTANVLQDPDPCLLPCSKEPKVVGSSWSSWSSCWKVLQPRPPGDSGQPLLQVKAVQHSSSSVEAAVAHGFVMPAFRAVTSQAISSCLASPSPHLRALNLWGGLTLRGAAPALVSA